MTVAYHVTGGDTVYPPSVVLEGLDSYGRDKLIADLRQYLPMVTALPLPVAPWRPSPATNFQLKTGQQVFNQDKSKKKVSQRSAWNFVPTVIVPWAIFVKARYQVSNKINLVKPHQPPQVGIYVHKSKNNNNNDNNDPETANTATTQGRITRQFCEFIVSMCQCCSLWELVMILGPVDSLKWWNKGLRRCFLKRRLKCSTPTASSLFRYSVGTVVLHS